MHNVDMPLSFALHDTHVALLEHIFISIFLISIVVTIVNYQMQVLMSLEERN